MKRVSHGQGAKRARGERSAIGCPARRQDGCRIRWRGLSGGLVNGAETERALGSGFEGMLLKIVKGSERERSQVYAHFLRFKQKKISFYLIHLQCDKRSWHMIAPSVSLAPLSRTRSLGSLWLFGIATSSLDVRFPV